MSAYIHIYYSVIYTHVCAMHIYTYDSVCLRCQYIRVDSIIHTVYSQENKEMETIINKSLY
jgi:hypothetical protein